MLVTKPTTAFAALLIAGPLAACGDDDTSEEPAAPKPAPTVLEVTALRSGPDGAYRFDVKHLEAKAGPITIDFRNGDTTSEHNIRIQTGSKCCFGRQNKDVGGTNTIDPGTEETATLTLEPGRYVFLCSLGGHWNSDIGKMRGTLVVN
jgi:hypothetical protein